MRLVMVDARERFLRRLAGIEDPEQKRKIIGDEFIRVFEEEASKLGRIDFLTQGTLYPDVIESATSETKAAQKIKTHHNVGGLPAVLRFSLIEPLRYLFKDEVRAVGTELGLPEAMVQRQPFPGPGLAIRIIGEVTADRLATLREADWIVIDEIKAAGLYRSLWQSFAILTPVRSVGVMGDGRTYANVVAIRAVTSEDGMTADWAKLPGRREPTKQRGGILGRISGEAGDEMPSAADLKSFEAPSPDVRREMLRLEIEAERQKLEQEAAALALEGRLVDGSPNADTVEEPVQAGEAADSAEGSGESQTAADLPAGAGESETREDTPA